MAAIPATATATTLFMAHSPSGYEEGSSSARHQNRARGPVRASCRNILTGSAPSATEQSVLTHAAWAARHVGPGSGHGGDHGCSGTSQPTGTRSEVDGAQLVLAAWASAMPGRELCPNRLGRLHMRRCCERSARTRRRCRGRAWQPERSSSSRARWRLTFHQAVRQSVRYGS